MSQSPMYGVRQAGSLGRLVFWVVAASAILSKTTAFIEGLAVGDILFAGALILIVYSNLMYDRKLSVDVYCVTLIGFIVWVFWVGAYRSFTSPLSFSEEKFLRSGLKLLFYGSGTFLIIDFLRRIPESTLHALTLEVLTFSAVIALYIYAVMALELPLPYEFLWYGQVDVGKDTAFYRQTEVVAAKGLFVEPSLLGLFHALGLACVYLSPTARLNLFGWRQVLVVVSLLLSYSLTGYILLFLVVLLHLFRSRDLQSLSVAVAIFLLPVAVVATSEFLQEVIILRIANSMAGVDNSSAARLHGSLDVAWKFLGEAPFFGVGLGNFDYAQLSLRASEYDIGAGDQGWNILAYVAGTTGLIGLALFASSLAAQIAGAALLALVFIASMFTTGAFLEPMFWFYYALVAVAASRHRASLQPNPPNLTVTPCMHTKDEA